MKSIAWLLSLGLLCTTWASSPTLAASYRKNRKHKGFQTKKKEYTLKKVKKKDRSVAAPKQRRPVELEAFDRFLKETVKIKTREQIQTLEDLIRSTPEKNNEKAGLYFRLAEHYWENSKYYDFQAHSYDDFKGKPDWPQKKRMQMQARRQAKQYRQKAADVYYKIISDPAYKNYPRMCEAYYFLGKNLFDMGQQIKALKVFNLMLRRYRTQYPKCPFIPNAYLAFGEHYFNSENKAMNTALRSYKNVLSFPKSSIYGFALYKIAWCHYNLVQYDVALRKFVGVVRHAQRKMQEGGGRRDIKLLKESLRDLVVTYARIKNPSYPANARRYFFQVGGAKNYVKMLENLGFLYRAKGKFEGMITVYKDLMNIKNSEPKSVLYQYNITFATSRIASGERVYRSIDTLGQRILRFRRTHPNDKHYKEAVSETKQLIREFAQQRHYEANKTRNRAYYADAGRFYKAYIKYFPNEKDSYTMRFWYAELLYKLRRFDEAAPQYQICLKMNPKGKYSADAAYNAVLSYNNLMRRKRLDVENTSFTASKRRKIQKRPFPPLVKKFLGASEDYMKYFPKNNRAIDVAYKAALIYYSYDHFDEALPRFYFLVKKYPKHKYAIYAAHSILDVYQLQANWSKLHKESWAFYKMEGLGDQKFKREVRELIMGSGMKTCEEIESKQKKYLDAAQCYQRFAKEFPDNKKLAPIALNNTASNYYRAKQPEKALNARHELIRRFPNSKFTKETVLSLADIYADRADFEKAAGFYEKFAERYPSDSKRHLSLIRAAVFREAMGQKDKSVGHYQTLLRDRKFKRSKPKTYRSLYMKLAEGYKAQKNREGLRRYSLMMKDFDKKRMGPIAHRLYARGEYILARHKMGFRSEALRKMKQLPRSYDTLPKKAKAAYPEAGGVVAQIRFMLADKGLEKYKKIKLARGMSPKTMKKVLANKEKESIKAFKVYDQIRSYKQAKWTIASLFRIGEIFEDNSNFFANAPMPNILKEVKKTFDKRLRAKRIPYAMRKKFIAENAPATASKLEMQLRMQLQQKAQPYEQKAIEYYTKCLKISHGTRVYNKWSDLALKRLQELRPGSYPKNLTPLPKPGYASTDFKFRRKVMGGLSEMPPPTPPKKASVVSKRTNR